FDLIIAVDILTQPGQLALVQVLDPHVTVNLGGLQNLLAGRPADPVDIGQRNFNTLVTWNINACNTCHGTFPLLSVLAQCPVPFSPGAACASGSCTAHRARRAAEQSYNFHTFASQKVEL